MQVWQLSKERWQFYSCLQSGEANIVDFVSQLTDYQTSK